MLTGSAQVVTTALLVIFALFALVALIRKAYMSRHRELGGTDVACADDAGKEGPAE